MREFHKSFCQRKAGSVMYEFCLISGILLGVSLGLGFALRITVALIMRSNNIGDFSGTCDDFGCGIKTYVKKDRISKKKSRDYFLSSYKELEHSRDISLNRMKKQRLQRIQAGATDTK